MSKSATLTERANSIAKLREWLKPGARVGTILRHCSRSGMSRSISCIINSEHGPFNIDYHVAKACGFTIDRNHGGIKVSGCGMDMGFHIVYSLGRALYHEGFRWRDHGRTIGRNGMDPDAIDTDGGYSLSQYWI